MKTAPRSRTTQQHKNKGLKIRRTKQDSRTSDQMDPMDKISEVPDHVMHHILSFLCTKDACRTSTLSKRWRSIWNSFPILDFDQRNFKEKDKMDVLPDEEKLDMANNTFINYVNQSLMARRLQNLSIQKFRLCVNLDDQELVTCMHRWVTLVTECNVKELDLQVKKGKGYTCPEVALGAKTLTALRLHRCRLKSPRVINLPFLQKLNLREIHISQKIFEDLMRGSPVIVDIRLVYCKGLRHLQVVGLEKLNRLELHQCFDLKKVDVLVPNLQTFWYYGRESIPCKIELSGCKTLKRLTLEDANMTNEWFENNISNFPALENLVLSRCRKLRTITLFSEQLRRLSLKGCNNLVGVMSNTPRLTSFEYEGDDRPLSSVDPSTLHEATVSLEPSSLSAVLGLSSNISLSEFVGKFNHSSGLKLVLHYGKNVVIYEELQKFAVPPISNVKVEVIKPSTSFEALLNNVMQSCHPERLSLVVSSCKQALKFLREMREAKAEKPSCCSTNVNCCWRHYLEEFAILSLEEEPEASKYGMMSLWHAWLKASMPESNPYHFKLKWKKKSEI